MLDFSIWYLKNSVRIVLVVFKADKTNQSALLYAFFRQKSGKDFWFKSFGESHECNFTASPSPTAETGKILLHTRNYQLSFHEGLMRAFVKIKQSKV